MRGFAAVALDNTKNPENIGGVLRAAGIFGASLVVISGNRIKKYMNHPTDTMKAYRTVPTVITSDVFEALPYSCVPVAVDILDGAVPLPDFKHPERAFYIFGPEDSTLGKRIVDRCPQSVIVPSSGSLNLAAAVNVVLYDRIAKWMKLQNNG
ncbi:MAG: RNA methyltransferase [Gammaproteobacteria bacterium]|nr:RNA methyltransferase [Gammaproteobacteria bacterium]